VPDRECKTPQRAVSKLVFGLIREYNQYQGVQVWIEEISFMDERNRKIKTIIDSTGCSMSVTGENEEKWLSLKPNEKIVAADVMTCEEQAVKI